MRRLGVLMLLLLVTISWSKRADAHVCPYAAQIPVGQSSTVPVYVTVESVSTPDVEVDVPSELRLENAAAPQGWKMSRDGQTLRFRGPAFAPFTCPSFGVRVTAPAKGVFPILVIQRDAHGDVITRSITDPQQRLSPGYSPTVYAGVKPPSPSNGDGPSVTTIAGLVLVGLGAVLAAGIGWRARRAQTRDAELQERLDEFRKQTRDRRAERSQP